MWRMHRLFGDAGNHAILRVHRRFGVASASAIRRCRQPRHSTTPESHGTPFAVTGAPATRGGTYRVSRRTRELVWSRWRVHRRFGVADASAIRRRRQPHHSTTPESHGTPFGDNVKTDAKCPLSIPPLRTFFNTSPWSPPPSHGRFSGDAAPKTGERGAATSSSLQTAMIRAAT